MYRIPLNARNFWIRHYTLHTQNNKKGKKKKAHKEQTKKNKWDVVVVVGHHIQQINLQSCLWSLNREKLNFPCPRSRLGNLVSRDGFSRPVPRQPAHSPRPG